MRIHQYALCSLMMVSSLVSPGVAFIAPSQSNTFVAPLASAKHVYETNRAMDEIAEKCGDVKKPVVALASKVEDMYNEADGKDSISFNVLLKAWARCCTALEKQKYKPTDKAMSMDDKVPTVAVYTPRDAVEHLTKRLMLAEAAYEENPDTVEVIPDETSYNIAIGECPSEILQNCHVSFSFCSHLQQLQLLLLLFLDAWAKSKVADGTQAAERLLGKMISNPRLEPSSITYNAVLDSHAHSPDPHSLQRMSKIWQHMQKLADEGNEKIKPNLRTVNMILTACVRKAEMVKDQDLKMDCARHAKEILTDVKERNEAGKSDLSPDVMTYSIVMDSFARVGSTQAAEAAEELMRELQQTFADTGEVRKQPNFRTYTTLIGAWSRTPDKRAARKAEELVQEMEDVYQKRMEEGRAFEKGEETTRPNARTFTAVIHALSRSRDSDKSKRVLKVLMKMRKLAESEPDCAPFINSYNQGRFLTCLRVTSKETRDAPLSI